MHSMGFSVCFFFFGGGGRFHLAPLEVGDQQQLPPPVQDRLKLTKAGGMSCLEYVTEGALSSRP